MVDVSVIVPVFNNELYLRKCLDSLINQSLDNIEIIVVDDGSIDRSGIICDEFADKYEQCVVIHKKNEGVSQARNDGIKKAKGKYIGFVDSDDWVDQDMFMNMYQKAEEEQSDIVICDVMTVYSAGKAVNDTLFTIKKSGSFQKKDIRPLTLGELAGSACRCIYRNSLLVDNQISFPFGIKLSEDRIFNLYALGGAEKISYIKFPYYFRTINGNSAVHKFHPDYFDTVKKSYRACLTAIDSKWKGNENICYIYKKQFAFSAISAINNCFYKTSIWTRKQKYEQVRQICSDNDLHLVLKRIKKTDIRLWLMLKKQVTILCIISGFLNCVRGR